MAGIGGDSNCVIRRSADWAGAGGVIQAARGFGIRVEERFDKLTAELEGLCADSKLHNNFDYSDSYFLGYQLSAALKSVYSVKVMRFFI